MKILMATMGLDIGGAETHIVELAKELKHQGHDVAIISNGGVYVPRDACLKGPSLPFHPLHVLIRWGAQDGLAEGCGSQGARDDALQGRRDR